MKKIFLTKTMLIHYFHSFPYVLRFDVFLYRNICLFTLDFCFECRTHNDWIITQSGLIWSEVKQLWDVGLQEYVHDMWNVIDFITNSLYVATVALRVVSYFQVSISVLISPWHCQQLCLTTRDANRTMWSLLILIFSHLHLHFHFPSPIRIIAFRLRKKC